jgi:hypothetical protein
MKPSRVAVGALHNGVRTFTSLRNILTNMKSITRNTAVAAIVAVGGLGAIVHGSATAPTVTITSPTTGTTLYGTFPYTVPLTFDITHADQGDLNSVKDLTITAQRAGDVNPTTVVGPVDAFAGNNTCANPIPAGILTCSVTPDGETGSLTVNWQVPQAGTYTFVVTAKHGNADGSDTIQVVFDIQTVDLEYPAPPAIANAFINSLSSTLRKGFTAGVRGCVISQIAELHGKQEYYGNKPGPYNTALVRTDVRSFSQACGGPIVP